MENRKKDGRTEIGRRRRAYAIVVSSAFIILGAIFNVACSAALAAGATAPRWDDGDISALLGFAEALPVSGVDAAGFAFADLERTWRAGDRAVADGLADSLFGEIAAALQSGAVPPARRLRWRIEPPAPDAIAIALTRESAITDDAVAETLAGFEPQRPEYRALKTALASASDDSLKRTIRLNMERWRWMPRDLGTDYVFVNVPAYEAIVVRDGKETWRSRVIVGSKKTPTWQFSALVEGVAFNPTWFVPASIVAESVGVLLKNKPKEAARLGYYLAEDGGVRQKPGPRNSLGEVKLLMPNPYGVFLHDTPFKTLFEKEKRALSHGCIRVEDPLGLAEAVLGAPWTRETIEEIAATGETTAVNLEAPIPVYVAYFTATVDAEGALVTYPDIYGLDRSVTLSEASAEMSNSETGCSPV